jgi:hypothetical protein
MRIVFLIPFYSVMNIFAVLFLHHSEYFELAKSIYESIAIVAFHRLLLSYIAPDEESRNIYFERKEPVKNFGFGLVSNQHTFNAKAMFLVSQFVFVRTFLNIIAAILQSRDAYCPQGGPKFGSFWVKIISIISMVSALYGILCVYWVAHDDIASRKTTQKFLTVKLTIFVFLVQNSVLVGLLQRGKITVPDQFYLTPSTYAIVLQSLIENIELLFLILVFAKLYNPQEYMEYVMESFNNSMSFRQAIGDSANLHDFWVELKQSTTALREARK